ncbi:MAG: aspartate-semialdehyde dehydrogenase [Gammaproteobacteria bacterium]|nr:aspartate-semialdehyde dehydrogenase [Gammaproteobacteria bacterium]MDH4315884.1 aspartate-semialdehyde dehydrogenase [Gammaproteobacteria bacterium]MDH5213070.1 aspartate-semialdehyde dehydrogenase [Gammaproteobacteria bacterium]MDH5500002.1 aspartate-semialdehyde dehydrogenase [Gammaproteobacteria bacterium]
MSKVFDVAVVGATGVVGEAMLQILSERRFPAGKVHALASERSVGKSVAFGKKMLKVQDLAGFDFSKVQIGLFSAGASVSGEYAPKAAAAGCVVVDNTSRFRQQDDIPLVVPEVNPEKIAGYTAAGIIANPNCSTIQMVVALKPIYDAVGIRRINVATYQAVSGAGRSAVEELARQTAALLNGKPLDLKGPAKQIAFNAVPHIDVFQENRYTREEMKMVWETRKILADENIAVNPTAVRIAAFFGHSEAVHIETERKISASEVCELLRKAPGVKLIDGTETGQYPTAVTDSSGNDPVFVGRVREDISHPRGINLWVVSDNIRKGAALNSVQIAEILAKKYL